MRCLISVHGETGHYRPVLPIARELCSDGNEVVLFLPPNAAADPEVAGLKIRAAPGKELLPGDLEAFKRRIESLPIAQRPAVTLGRFIDAAEALVPHLLAAIDDLRPDVLLRETTGWAAWLAGELRGLPVASFDFQPAPGAVLDQLSGGRLAAARARFGLDPDPELASLHRWLTIVGAPPSWFRLEALPPTVHLIQPPEPLPADDRSIDALFDGLPDRPTVYATLGTTFNAEPGLFDLVLRGLAELDVNVIATIGRNLDAASLGPQPDHVRLVAFVPQSLLFPRCDAVVAHGGYGSLMGALRFGLPVVSVPVAAIDNVLNARRLEKLGAGLAVHEADRSASAVARAVKRVLSEPEFRMAAGRLAEEIATLPPPAHAAGLLVRLGETKRPVARGSDAPRAVGTAGSGP